VVIDRPPAELRTRPRPWLPRRRPALRVGRVRAGVKETAAVQDVPPPSLSLSLRRSPPARMEAAIELRALVARQNEPNSRADGGTIRRRRHNRASTQRRPVTLPRASPPLAG
jgi:hypothetical protein